MPIVFLVFVFVSVSHGTFRYVRIRLYYGYRYVSVYVPQEATIDLMISQRAFPKLPASRARI